MRICLSLLFSLLSMGWLSSAPCAGQNLGGPDLHGSLKADDNTCLRLNNGRFEVRVNYQGFSDEAAKPAQGVLLDEETGFDETGYFYLDDQNNIDLMVRVFTGCQFNNHYWVFAGSLTKVAYEITVTDTQSGLEKQYTNQLGNAAAPVQDTQAFATCPSPSKGKPQPNAAIPEAISLGKMETISLMDGRFILDVDWLISDQNMGRGTASVQTTTSGAFWFIDRSDPSVYLKITDGRAVNGHYWLSYTSLTGAQYTLNIRDTQTGRVRTIFNPFNTSTFGTDLFLDAATPDRLVYPWVSNNQLFESTLVVNNDNCLSADVTLTATRGNGQSQTVEREIPASGFLEEAASELFPELGNGSGYSVLLTSPVAGLNGRWVTNNLNTPSQNSPSQGNAVNIPGQIDRPVGDNARVGHAISFGYLPLRTDSFAGTVITNVGDVPADVTLVFYDNQGRVLDLNREIGRGLAPLRPLATVTRDLFPGREDSISMIAYSPDQPLTGVTFVFNQDGEPAIGNANAINWAPPQ